MAARITFSEKNLNAGHVIETQYRLQQFTCKQPLHNPASTSDFRFFTLILLASSSVDLSFFLWTPQHQPRTRSAGLSLTRPANMSAPPLDASQCIREVWASNLIEEMKTIRQIVQTYTYIAVDTKFPGLVNHPKDAFRTTMEYQYKLLKCNVDVIKIIQLGITFMNEDGEFPPGTRTWQFNFKFNLTEDVYSKRSIDLLRNSGVQFEKHQEEGIDTLFFAELLISSGLVLFENVKWLSFHSCYDFGSLVKLLTNARLPEEGHDFFKILHIFFPAIYDVKYLMKSCKDLEGDLQDLADQLKLPRIGQQHQAGSDSMLTGMAFFRLKELYFEDNIDDGEYCRRLYGLFAGSIRPQNAISSADAEENNNED